MTIYLYQNTQPYKAGINFKVTIIRNYFDISKHEEIVLEKLKKQKNINYLRKGLIILLCVIIISHLPTSNASIEIITEPPIIWNDVDEYGQSGRVTLSPEDSSVIIPVEFEIPLKSLLRIRIDPYNDYSLWGLPIKYHFSDLLPQNDFEVVRNITMDDTDNIGENVFWVGYQRVATTSNQANFTLTLDEDWNKPLDLHIHMTLGCNKFNLSENKLSLVFDGDTGYGSNQTFLLAFFVNSSSTSRVKVSIDRYQEIFSPANFTVTPGEYYELIARTVIYDYNESPEHLTGAGRFFVNVSCVEGEYASGIFVLYPLRPYDYLNQDRQVGTPASGFTYQFVFIILLLLTFNKFCRPNNKKRIRE